jgi:serine/threonine protein kinase
MSNSLLYLKEMNVNHRDIKLENFVIVGNIDPVVKLIDFGLSTRCPGTSKYTKKGNPLSIGDIDKGKQKIFEMGGGTPFYIAPENVQSDSYNTHKGDVFAFGLCILELFYPAEPNGLSGHSQTMLNAGDITKRIQTNFPERADDLQDFYNEINKSVFNENAIIEGLLEKEPTERPEIEKVLVELRTSLNNLTDGGGAGK